MVSVTKKRQRNATLTGEIFYQKGWRLEKNVSLHAKNRFSQTFYIYNLIPKSGTCVILFLDLNFLYFLWEVDLPVNFVIWGSVPKGLPTTWLHFQNCEVRCPFGIPDFILCFSQKWNSIAEFGTFVTVEFHTTCQKCLHHENLNFNLSWNQLVNNLLWCICHRKTENENMEMLRSDCI